MSQTLDSVDDTAMEVRLRLLEARIEELERWRDRAISGPAGFSPPVLDGGLKPAAPQEIPSDDVGFDLALIGRTLIVLGGAYLLRAVTESGVIPATAGVLLGLLYAVSWSFLSLRQSVSRASAAHHGAATALTSLPLILEATMKFKVLDAWSASLALTVVSAVVLYLVWRRTLHGIAWTFALMAIAISPMLMSVTSSMVPFALYLTALGIATVWLGYLLEWWLLRWIVAAAADIALFVLCFLVATNQLPSVTPATAILVSCVAVAAYLATFAVRTLVKQRDAVAFEVAQTIVLLVAALGSAMWVAASRATLEVPLAIAMLVLAAASYAVAFAFIPRRFATPTNFVFYSSLGLMLIVMGGAFLTKGIANAVLWTVLALASGYLSVRYQKSSLALHSAVYLFSGFVGADVLQLGFRSLLVRVDGAWPVPTEGAVLLFVAAIVAAGIRPIERKGTFELWTAAKVMILAELGWVGASLFISALGSRWLDGNDAAVVAVVRTAVLGGLTVLTAWGSRYATLSPGRYLCTPLLVALGVKLLWEDLRAGRPATLFISFAIVGVVLIVTPQLRRKTLMPQPA